MGLSLPGHQALRLGIVQGSIPEPVQESLPISVVNDDFCFLAAVEVHRAGVHGFSMR